MSRSIITAEDIRHLAALAQLNVSPDEIERLQKELSELLNYFEKLVRLDTRDAAVFDAHLDSARSSERADEARYWPEATALIPPDRFPNRLLAAPVIFTDRHDT